jgi:hypothetical protein
VATILSEQLVPTRQVETLALVTRRLVAGHDLVVHRMLLLLSCTPIILVHSCGRSNLLGGVGRVAFEAAIASPGEGRIRMGHFYEYIKFKKILRLTNI